MQSFLLVFLALLLAHFLSDFLFQTDFMARHKGRQLLPTVAHAAIHYVSAWLCLLFVAVRFTSLRNQVLLLSYAVMHAVIDCAKSWLTRQRKVPDNWVVFFIDQLAHLVTVLLLAAILTATGGSRIVALLWLSADTKYRVLLTATVYAGAVFGGGYLIRYLTRGLSAGITVEGAGQLKNAGLYIGWLERFLVITAVALQSPAMVGLILTSKSIARFPEFKDVGFAEYFLIGSQLSFALALMGGMILVRSFYGTFALR